MILNRRLKLALIGARMSKSEDFNRVHFREDRFVQHSFANQAIDEMQFVYELSGQNRRPVNLALIGEGGIGKTSLIQHFLSSIISWEPQYSKFGYQQNVSFFDLPPRVTKNKLLNCILNPAKSSTRRVSLGEFASQSEAMGLKLIVIDEFSELERTHKNYRYEVLHAMKWIGNNLNIPFIVSGTNGIEDIFKKDPQMGRRFNIINMKTWCSGREFEYFVYSYLKSLPGFEGIKELNNDLFDVLLTENARTTFDVVTILSDAAFQAYTHKDINNIHIYARQLAMKSGNVANY